MSLYRFLRPMLFTLPPETAHGLTLRGLNLLGRFGAPPQDEAILAQHIMGLDFANPFGMAAGFDKDGTAIAGVHRIGFGFAEIGTLTPLPQPEIQARACFVCRNTVRSSIVWASIIAAKPQPCNACKTHALWRAGRVNIGANKEAEDRIADYETGAARFADCADYLTVNISSPNTPGLRDLQSGEAAGEIMRRVRAAAPDIPVLVKIAPDMRHEEAIGLAELALAENIDGLIISNTTWRAMVWRAAHMPMRQAVYRARRFSTRRPICCAPFTAPSVSPMAAS